MPDVRITTYHMKVDMSLLCEAWPSVLAFITAAMNLTEVAINILYAFCRERAAGYYATYPFALAQFLIEVPYVLAQSVFFSVITYFMIYFYIDAGKSSQFCTTYTSGYTHVSSLQF